jgi:2-keto-3-deoxy-L-rhamnonate aldolase RhmA
VLDLRHEISRRACVGTFVKVPALEIVDVLQLAGFDFLIVDMEHAQLTEEHALRVVRHCHSVGIPAVVRLPDAEPGGVNRLLEAGAAGIQLPRLARRAQAGLLNDMLKFPPQGRRSTGRANVLARYGAVPLGQYLQSENARTIAIGQFETRELDEPADDLMAHLDVAFIGPTDLSVDFGVPDDLSDDRVQGYLRNVQAAATRTSTALGIFAATAAQAIQSIQDGYRYVAVGGDISMLMREARSLVSSITAAVQSSTEG